VAWRSGVLDVVDMGDDGILTISLYSDAVMKSMKYKDCKELKRFGDKLPARLYHGCKERFFCPHI